jgi:penicillin G amidase
MMKVLLALFFAVILVVPGLTWWIAQRPVPVLEGIAEVTGMLKPVLVRYDSRAIPYIKADLDEDLYAAQGYLVARERMFQMDMLRRAARGRISQVYGLPALPADRLMRTIGFERLAAEELKNLTPQARSALEAYVRGVNAYLTENADKLPVEFTILSFRPEAWTDIDSLAIMKYVAYQLDESWKLDELRFRVTNKVGDNLAARLFDDDLSVSAWSPELRLAPAPLGETALPAAPAAGGSPAGAHAVKKTGWRPAASTLPKSAPAPARGLAPEPAIRPAPRLDPVRSDDADGQPGAFLPVRQPPECRKPAAAQRAVCLTAMSQNSLRLSERLMSKFAQLSRQSEFLARPARTWGSTAFVLSPSFSKSGGAMLAADKHSALTNPCEFFICSLHSNNIHVAGAALPGVPGIMFGRNQLISWSGASMHADVQDLFVEHFASEAENKYKTPGKVETAQEFHEAIPVRFGKDVDHKITITKHGPVLLRDQESGIAISWTGFETRKPWLNSLCALNRASDWASFCQALSVYSGPPQLFVYADKRGNVGCHGAGILPVRSGDAQGTTMSEGWLSRGEWISSIAFGDLPQSFMPALTTGRPSGDFCVAAGQKLQSAPAHPGRPAQLWGHQWDAPYRANRLALSLPRGKNAQKLDLFDFNAYQGDELNMMAGLVVSELKKAMEMNKSIDVTQTKAMELMQRWDCSIKHDSAAASCYESFVGALARRLVEARLGRELANEYFQNWPLWSTFVEDYLRRKPKDLLPTEERTHETFLLDTFNKSNTRLKLLFKNDRVETWLWEKAHIANFKSVGLRGVAWLRYLLDINGIGVGGDSNCLNACDVDRVSVSGEFRCLNGPSIRLLIDMSDDDAFYGNLSLGQSGHYFSPYRQDELKSWLRADPLPIAFSETQAEKQSRHKFYLAAPGYK